MKKHFSVLALVLGFVLCVYSVLLLTMFVWALIASVSADSFSVPAFGFPDEWHFENYVRAFSLIKVPVPYHGTQRYVHLWEMLFNGLVYSLGCAVVATLTPCIMAYLTAKYRFRLNAVIHTIVIVTMILPIVGSLPSEMQLVRALGFQNNMLGMFVMKANFLGMYFLVFYGTFKGLPWEYAEAAFIDGASHFTVLVRVMLPLVKNTIMVVILLQFIGFWNDYQTPMLYIPNIPTASFGLYQFANLAETGTGSIPMRLAASVIVMAPMVVLFILFKDKFIGNLTVGGIKG